MLAKNLHRASVPVLALFLQLQLVAASPFSTPQPTNSLTARDCTPCGYYGQACCSASETCSTNSNNQAVCIPAGSGGGQWEYFTTTYVRTDFVTVTSTGSRPISQPTGQPQCKVEIGETECGSTCCTAAQSCNENLVCVQAGGSPFPTTNPAPTPPTRPTSTQGVTVTTIPATTTIPFIPAVGTDGSSVIGITKGSGGLSGGAIAGIVIGSIAGALILMLICICCCVGSCVDRVRAMFGIGGRKPSRHSAYTGSSSYSSHHGWFGGGSRVSSEKNKKKKTGFLGLASLGVVIGAIALCLGLRRRKDDKSTTYYTGSSYTYSSSSSSSSSSSGQRTQRS
ncbi:hypothetical protein McanCB56680_001496 [Microsporum canis]|uniref:Mid2 domain-containing protein n=1 Tax=Arthroderma otae (strain ATCC MYA-4605 / CBS 113480) TaxID=554155 RepID=C5FH04_ARTOC|nr:conserved hypothetical protein [Microsporum canis CBS 113480]EEQ28634.1 conserved hypothetical protein [Microsporum canis CBS 113480]